MSARRMQEQMQEQKKLVDQLIRLDPNALDNIHDALGSDIEMNISVLRDTIAQVQQAHQANLPQPKQIMEQQGRLPFFNRPIVNQGTGRRVTARAGTGMRDVLPVLLNMKRDLRRVTGALSEQGMENIVNKHNENTRNGFNKWKWSADDVNHDGVPDYIISNATTDEPIIVNGWTTKPSDFPIRARYHKSDRYRTGVPYKRYKDYLLENDDDFYSDAQSMGWQISRPMAFDKRAGVIEKLRESAYYMFRQLFDQHAGPVVDWLVSQGSVPTKTNKDGIRVMAKKISVLSAACALIWNNTIMATLRREWGVENDDNAWITLKKSQAGKEQMKAYVIWLVDNINNRGNGDNFKQEIVRAITSIVGDHKGDGASAVGLFGKNIDNSDFLNSSMPGHKPYPKYNGGRPAYDFNKGNRVRPARYRQQPQPQQSQQAPQTLHLNPDQGDMTMSELD